MSSRAPTITHDNTSLSDGLSILSATAALVLSLVSTAAISETVVVDGSSMITNGNLLLAREEAIRDALAEAGRQTSLSVRSTLGTTGAQLDFDQTVVKASARVYRHQVINEHHDTQWYRVTVSADLESSAERTGDSACRDGHINRLLVGGFPMLRPEQLRMNELSGYAHLTAREIAGRFSTTSAVLVDHNGSLMLHFSIADQASGDMPRSAQDWTLSRAAAEKHRAQYLLVGRYHSLALSQNGSSRTIDIEALIIDASSGSCVARKRFESTASGYVVLSSSIGFGSAGHYSTDLGRAYGEVLTNIARWAEAITSCQPFLARVVKVDGNSIYFDAGAEQGITIGNNFSAFASIQNPVVTNSGEILGLEKKLIGNLSVTTVYPKFSIGQLSAPLSGTAIKKGDELYSQ